MTGSDDVNIIRLTFCCHRNRHKLLSLLLDCVLFFPPHDNIYTNGIMELVYPDPRSVFNRPELPFWCVVPGGLRPRLLICISGHPVSGAKRFEVNFVVGNSLDPYTCNKNDIAFHFNPRFSQKVVVCNTRQQMVWGKEEIKPNPLVSSAPFDLLFLVEMTGFKVAANGKHYTEYSHRIPFSTANLLSVTGDVVINSITIRNEPVFPVRSLTVENVSANEPLVTVYNPAVPFLHPFPAGLKPNNTVYISGRPNLAFDRFTINFLTIPHANNEKDVVFHFNPRLRERCVVRNAFALGVWGSEERTGSFPFAPGVNFDMIIRVDSPKTILIAVNGQHFTSFNVRREGALSDVREMSIDGSLTLTCVRISA